MKGNMRGINSLDRDEDLLLSRGMMYKLILLPHNCPFNSKDSEIITSNLTKEEDQTTISDLQKCKIDRYLKTKSDDDSKGYRGYKSKEEYISDILYSTWGNLSDMPNLKSLPEEIRQLLNQYQ